MAATTARLRSLPPPMQPLFSAVPLSPPAHLTFLPIRRQQSFTLRAADGPDGGGSVDRPTARAPPPITPPDTAEIRFRRGSRRRRQQQELGEDGRPMKAQARAPEPPPVPKKWEEMSLQEKALELYVGEKGMLFWLNKFAYASIYIVIGAWILFRFVGPALNLYQLDSTPLPPAAMFKD